MVNDSWLEIPVFIHGLTEERKPDSHRRPFFTLLNDLNQYIIRKNKSPLNEPPMAVEWGFDLSPGKDKYLARVEAQVAEHTFAIIKQEKEERLWKKNYC